MTTEMYDLDSTLQPSPNPLDRRTLLGIPHLTILEHLFDVLLFPLVVDLGE
jgi:hypothetical protein